jgi:hypothetical protein
VVKGSFNGETFKSFIVDDVNNTIKNALKRTDSVINNECDPEKFLKNHLVINYHYYEVIK